MLGNARYTDLGAKENFRGYACIFALGLSFLCYDCLGGMDTQLHLTLESFKQDEKATRFSDRKMDAATDCTYELSPH